MPQSFVGVFGSAGRSLPRRFKIIVIIIVILLILVALAVWVSRPRKLAVLLGYPSDARLFIIHADDFGVCRTANIATIKALETGVVTCAAVMVPSPAFDEAAAYCRENPDADIGIHLTFTNEYADYKWGPVSPVSEVPTLVNSDGHFYLTTQEVWEHGSAEQIESEMRAQIEKALAAGIRPTHLDSHMGVLFGPKFIRTYLRVASEYELPVLMPREYVITEESRGLDNPYRGLLILELLQKLLSRWLDATGRLMIDRLYVGGLDEVAIVQDKYYKWVIEEMGPGVNEVLVHLALDSGDIDVLGERSERRVEDFRIMTDPGTRELIESQGITLIGFRPIMELVKKRK